jgi:hypothetical protein
MGYDAVYSGNQLFIGTYFLHTFLPFLHIEALLSSKTLLTICQVKQCHVPQDRSLNWTHLAQNRDC